MLIQSEPKIPTAFFSFRNKHRKKIRHLLAYFVTFAFLILLYYSLFMKKNKNNLTEADEEENTVSNYPSTSPAHLDDIYSQWSIPEETKIKLWKAVKKSPINKKTGRHTIIYFIANAGLTNFIINSLCSMKFAGIPKSNYVSIALDQQAYDAISKIGEPVVLLQSNFTKKAVNNNQIVDFYNIIKVKPTILHQFLLWNVEPILVDADTVFLENPFHVFNDESDFEVQCDSKEYYRIPNNINPPPWQVNLGFYKVHPTETVLKFMPFWLKRMYNASKVHDQSSLRKVLKNYPTFWINNDTISVHTSRLLGDDFPNLTFRFLDPMLITNAGGLYQEGAEDWKKEAKLRKIDKPEFIHFFHVGRNSEKLMYMMENELWFIDDQNKCKTQKPKGAIKFMAWTN